VAENTSRLLTPSTFSQSGSREQSYHAEQHPAHDSVQAPFESQCLSQVPQQLHPPHGYARSATGVAAIPASTRSSSKRTPSLLIVHLTNRVTHRAEPASYGRANLTSLTLGTAKPDRCEPRALYSSFLLPRPCSQSIATFWCLTKLPVGKGPANDRSAANA
jgi:hypothetical protein